MTAFQTMMLSWHGLPEIPSGASVARRLKSRIRRRLAAVDCRLVVLSKRWSCTAARGLAGARVCDAERLVARAAQRYAESGGGGRTIVCHARWVGRQKAGTTWGAAYSDGDGGGDAVVRGGEMWEGG